MLGIQGETTATHGYREIELRGGIIGASNSLRTPGDEQPSSVDNMEKYNGAIGKFPIIAIRQVSTAGNGIIFAATSRYGLMSRGDDRIWNFEE